MITPKRVGKSLFATLLFLGVCAIVTPARTKTTLNVGWRFEKTDVAEAQRPNFNDSSWQRINLPHTWNVDDPWDDKPGYDRGAAWYRRDLPITHRSGKRFFLYFEGANQVTDVYVNGIKTGSHIGGYSAFAFDITSLVRVGRNVVAVRVDNSFNEDIPPLTGDFNFYGGIYRDVWLIETGEVHFDVVDHASPGVTITAPEIEKGRGTVKAHLKISNDDIVTRSLDLVTTVVDPTNRVVARKVSNASLAPNSRSDISVEAVVRSPRLWSPDNPHLYRVRVSLREKGRVLDEIEQPLGFRWFSFDGERGFSLNGAPLKLRGTNRHQDIFGFGNAVPNALHVRDMQIIKNAGFNFVRLAHYPQDPAVLEACDRLGLLVWEETPLVNYITDSNAFADNSRRMVREMVRQHRNHPSIILWGYMNEIFLRYPDKEELYKPTVDLARDLNRIVKEEDPTRATTIAFHGHEVYNKAGLGEVADVVGWNLYLGWYSASVEEFGKFLDDQHRRYPHRPLIVSEYGANGDQRLHSSEPRRFDSTIDYQRFFHESYLQQLDERTYLSGSAIWNQFDFGAEQRGETIPHLNQKGMYTYDRKPKDIHFFYKARLSTDPVVHIAVDDSRRRAGIDGRKHRIDVYSNMTSVELFQGRRSLGKKAVDGTRKTSWEVVLAQGANTFTARGIKEGRVGTDLATIDYTVIDVGSPMIAINAGSNADFTDADGAVWIADQPYETGRWGFLGTDAKRIFSTPPDPNILNTLSDPLFQTQVEGLSEYRVDVPDGLYTVELLFAERRFAESGRRVFDVEINGERVLEKLDIAAIAGRNRAYVKRVGVDARGGISIAFRPLVGEPIVSGIRIQRVNLSRAQRK